MSVCSYYYWNYHCSLSDMILSVWDRLMITNECLQLLLFGVQNYHCSVSDMTLSARDRLMIANECLQ